MQRQLRGTRLIDMGDHFPFWYAILCEFNLPLKYLLLDIKLSTLQIFATFSLSHRRFDHGSSSFISCPS